MASTSRQEIRISRHAIERYQERVAPVLPAQARFALQQFVARGRARSTPRHWMTSVRREPGARFVYWAQQPDVCVVVIDATAVTVLVRQPARRLRWAGEWELAA